MNKDVASRFWEWVRITDPEGCWEWVGAKSYNGYGRFSIGGRYYGTHRVAYELFGGSIPTGMCILHSCDNPPCVNPAHLRLGTQLDNMRDMHAKGRARQGGPVAANRAKTHCKRGHPFAGDNLRPAGAKGRRCKMCSMLNMREQRARRRAMCPS